MYASMNATMTSDDVTVLWLCMLQGSKAQLEQVWEETDGLDPDDFDPKTFFKLHGENKVIIHLRR